MASRYCWCILAGVSLIAYAESAPYPLKHIRKVECDVKECEIYHTNGKVEEVSIYLLSVYLEEVEKSQLGKVQCDQYLCTYPSGRFAGLTPR